MLRNLFWILFLRMSVWRPLVFTSEMCRPLSELRVLSNRLHSLLWFFNLNCLLHSPLKLWRRQKCVAPHLSFSLVWNLYLTVFYIQIIHRRRRPCSTDSFGNSGGKGSEVTKLVSDRGAKTSPGDPSLVIPQDFSGGAQTSTVPICPRVKTSPMQPGVSGSKECWVASRKPVLNTKPSKSHCQTGHPHPCPPVSPTCAGYLGSCVLQGQEQSGAGVCALWGARSLEQRSHHWNWRRLQPLGPHSQAS